MTTNVRTVRLGRPFADSGRSIIINRGQKSYSCACGVSLHHIAPGDLYAVFMNPRTNKRERWHVEHLERNWTLIVVDADDNEVARFGC